MAIQWKDSLSIGISEIDSQHKELFGALDNLFEACKEGKGRAEVGKLIDFLGNYVVEHFKAEEKLQKENLYPQFLAHKKQHDEFLNSYKELKSKFESEGPTVVFVSLVNKKVLDWLINHIGATDKAFGEYLKSKS